VARRRHLRRGAAAALGPHPPHRLGRGFYTQLCLPLWHLGP
jgi:hypothetical protein